MAIYIGALIGGIDENGELRSPILNAADLRVALAARNVCAVALDLVVWRGSHGAPSAREHRRPEQPSETATCTGCWSTINGTVLGAGGQGPSARIAAVDNQRLPTSIECLPDPPHPTCRGHNATRERKPQIVISTPDVHDSLLQRFALVYFGTVSRRARGHSSGDISDADLPEEFFVNVTICWQSLQRHLMDPSSGRANFDIFLHTWVRSTQLQSRMLALFQPISAKLEPPNHSVWGPQFKREAALSTVSFNEASRWTSVARALAMLRQAQFMRGLRYTLLYITRPDIVLWRPVDLRRYCIDRVYTITLCHLPYMSRECPADFHFVLSSHSVERFSRLPRLFARYDFSLGINNFVKTYSQRELPLEVVPDHIVAGRHEEVARKISRGYLPYSLSPMALRH